jgi:hypothetical protein
MPLARFERVFSELFGFVLCVPDRLGAFFGGRVHGLDVLARCSSSPDGDRISAEGIAIPLMPIDAGEYTLIL